MNENHMLFQLRAATMGTRSWWVAVFLMGVMSAIGDESATVPPKEHSTAEAHHYLQLLLQSRKVPDAAVIRTVLALHNSSEQIVSQQAEFLAFAARVAAAEAVPFQEVLLVIEKSDRPVEIRAAAVSLMVPWYHARMNSEDADNVLFRLLMAESLPTKVRMSVMGVCCLVPCSENVLLRHMRSLLTKGGTSDDLKRCTIDLLLPLVEKRRFSLDSIVNEVLYAYAMGEFSVPIRCHLLEVLDMMLQLNGTSPDGYPLRQQSINDARLLGETIFVDNNADPSCRFWAAFLCIRQQRVNFKIVQAATRILQQETGYMPLRSESASILHNNANSHDLEAAVPVLISVLQDRKAKHNADEGLLCDVIECLKRSKAGRHATSVIFRQIAEDPNMEGSVRSAAKGGLMSE